MDEQGVHERILNASAFTIDSSRLPEAKELLLKFRADMAKLLEKKGGDETYELSVQLFKLTKNSATQTDQTPKLPERTENLAEIP